MPIHEGQHKNCAICARYMIREFRGSTPSMMWIDDVLVDHGGHSVVQGEVLEVRDGWK